MTYEWQDVLVPEAVTTDTEQAHPASISDIQLIYYLIWPLNILVTSSFEENCKIVKTV